MSLERHINEIGKGIPLDRIKYNLQGVGTISSIEGVVSEETHGNWRKDVKEYNKPGTVENWFDNRENAEISSLR